MSKPIYIQHYSQFFDGNGDPLAGGLLYTYEAGTTTPKDTFTDPAGTVPNPNPIVLDSEGKPENGAIYLDGTYKFVLHDSDDVPVSGAETDNVESYATQTQISEILEDVQEEIDTIQEQVLLSLVGQGGTTTITRGALLFTKIKDMVFLSLDDRIEYSGAPTDFTGTTITLSVPAPVGFRPYINQFFRSYIQASPSYFLRLEIDDDGEIRIIQSIEVATGILFELPLSNYAVSKPA
jgi:hypothetical protein